MKSAKIKWKLLAICLAVPLAVGALAALLASVFGAPLWLQLVWFFVISIAALCLTRPLAKKYINSIGGFEKLAEWGLF